MAERPGPEPLDLAILQATLRQFAADRQWQPFHTPKNLSTALMVEAAELAEIFQWMTPEQSARAHADLATRERIAHEIADVLLYLVQVADHTGVDIAQAVRDKLVLNARKYPAASPLGTGPVSGAALVDE
ncbi:nucleotide pyrophosphohydrolase [Ideonella sp. A 288]|uniref:nucleotide pyrophosphohydrolase n=1 Tax=Ideonella sp. A 288 TaxID=1962181 RepID=UPI00287393B5|nr:nucleotide pyrophosphohydrolase [Ideonella sp. A 288]